MVELWDGGVNMDAVIVSSVISAASAILVCIISNSVQANTTRKLIEYRIDELEKKVDKHNSVIDRTYKLEERTELQEEKIKVANNRISDLENFNNRK